MAKSTAKRGSKPAGKTSGKPRKRAPRRKAAQPERKLDIVEQAGKESFPASDAPSWTP